MYQYVFGPVQSRRFGLSLGVDLLGSKICSMNCPYCEIEKTTKFTMDRRAYVKAEIIINELTNFIKSNNFNFNYITLGGKGEPLLNSEISYIISYIKAHYPFKICILTNGSHLHNKLVRDEIKEVDLIMPSLDAISKRVFRKINIPHRSLDMNNILEGIKALRKEFYGELWLEILFVKGVNDNDEEISLLKDQVIAIHPDKVYVNTVYRPPAFSKTYPIAFEKLKILQKEFDQLIEPINKTIKKFNKKPINNLNEYQIKKKLKTILSFRPSTYNDLKNIFCLNDSLMWKKLKHILIDLVEHDILVVKKFNNEKYYVIKSLVGKHLIKKNQF